MSDTNCVTCGAEFPKPPPEGGAAGYARDDEGNRYCYECSFEREKEHMRKTGKAFVYVKLRGSWIRDPIDVTNWVGKKFGEGVAYTIHRCPAFGCFPSERRNIRFMFEGEVWAGTWYVSSGDYARVRRTKLKSLYGRGR